jgi:hypothetical protein
MKLIADDGPRSLAIEAYFAPIHDRDVTVVFLERFVAKYNRQDIPGLDDVLAHAPSGKPVIMFGWLEPRMTRYADDSRWHAALGYPNVVFRRLPEGLDDLVGAYEEAAGKNRPADPLAIALLGTQMEQLEVQMLHHNLDSALRRPEQMVDWLERARKQFGNKTEDELVETVRRENEKNKAAGKFSGETFPDTCIDVEGTLFGKDGHFRPAVLADAVAQANGNPITIWTAGDLLVMRNALRTSGVPYKLIPKQLLAGATVGTVVDDLPEAEFRERYGVNYDRYVQVGP